MIRSDFHKVFSLEVTHTYYTSNICKGLVYKPSKTTAQISKKYPLKLQPTNKGFEFYVNTKKTLPEFLNYITKVTGEKAFIFHAEVRDKVFYQFTNLPINQIGIIKYNSGLLDTNSEEKILILEPDFIPTLEANILFSLSINFKDLIALENQQKEADYQINFEARATQWKYFIVNNTGQNLGKLAISNTSGIEFKGPTDAVLQNGKKVQLFSPEQQLLSLSENPKYNFDLICTTQKNGKDRKKMLFKGLPNANPSIIEVNTELLEPIVASLMYVYV